VVKALVEATPISAPARVRKPREASRIREDSGALQMARVWVDVPLSLRDEGEAILFRKGDCFVAVAPRNDSSDSSWGESLR